MTLNRPRICQVLPNLQGGGAERVAINLGNDWVARGFSVDFALMDQRGEFLDILSPSATVHNLRASRIRQVPIRLFTYFRECQPEITLVHMWPLTSAAVLAWKLAGSPGRLFLCEHTTLSEQIRLDSSPSLRAVQACLRLSHVHASGVLAVSQGAASDLERISNLPERSVRVIYNPVVPAELKPRVPVQASERQKLGLGDFSYAIISIGMLIKVKNHLLLLDAFADLAQDVDAGLVILGEGPLRPVLEHRIRELGLQNRVLLPGFDADPDPWLRAADLFVLSSDFEGFGNVLVEALAAGTPVVSTSCPHGPDEILDHGRHGLLVPVGDRDALARSMRSALNRSWDSTALQRRALDFSIPKQSSAYLDFFGYPEP